MAYADLVERLADEPEERTITALPDGSVDVYYAVCDAEGERIEDRETLADRLTDGEPSFPIERESTEPGGQAVNMARQANALGNRVRLYGHLDNPVFDDLGFERVSMGEPSRIGIYPLDEDVLFSEVSSELADWTLEEFRAVADRPVKRLAADAVCCGNWASVPGMTEAFHELAEASIDGGSSCWIRGRSRPARTRRSSASLRRSRRSRRAVSRTTRARPTSRARASPTS
ncbi:hypothetical protein [Halalkalicoccus salilacus]|uniref:hypothetical protein n=1 Tax=Halalkalicoccus sp. GCM10025704 TaxID=3252662 RepID=UPI003614F71E